MLFKFEKFWQTLAIIMSSWIVYGIWNFEFAIVTILAWILAIQLQK